MYNMLSRNWGLVVLRGAIAILFGFVALLLPALALQTLLLLFAFYAFADGIIALWTAIQHRAEKGWWVHLLEGVVGILAGILTVAYPGITALILLYIIAAWAIMTGVFEIWAAIELRREIQGEFWLGLSGALSVIFGIVLIVAPGTGALAVVWLIGAYAVIFGITMVILGFQLRGFEHNLHNQAHGV